MYLLLDKYEESKYHSILTKLLAGLEVSIWSVLIYIQTLLTLAV